MMLPLDGKHVITHDVDRTTASSAVDAVVVASSTETADDILARYAERAGAIVFRGSESDVLERVYQAAMEADADIIVRITGDCPLVSPTVIDAVVDQLVETNVDYSTNIIDRTFPRGLDVEAFTIGSFECVYENATEPHHREHVTPYYHEQDDHFEYASVRSEDVFEEPWMQDRTALRLTLDEADDYELLRTVYEKVSYDDLLDVPTAVKYVDDNDLQSLNAEIEQKSP